MELGIKTSLSDKEIIKYLDKKRIVYKEEWDPLDRILYRLELVDGEEVDSDIVKKIKHFWIGMGLDDIDIFMDYEVSIAEGWIYLRINFYETFVEGFFEGVMFEIEEEDEAVSVLIEEWKEDLGKYLEYTELFE
jgi:hypothetical protein